MKNRTDMASELLPKRSANKTDTKSHKGIIKTVINIDEKLSAKYNKAQGQYVTVESTAVVHGHPEIYKALASELAEAITQMGMPMDNCLVVGLGNEHLTADALGSATCRKLMVTRHISPDALGLSAVTPSVLGITGIESYDIVKGVVDRIKPSCVIVVDSLASSSIARLGCAFQVSSAGITPGSGVANHRTTFDERSIGTKVMSVGVPLVVYASTIVRDAVGREQHNLIDFKKLDNLIVTPKDIDLMMEDCASIIALAINIAVHEHMDIETLERISYS